MPRKKTTAPTGAPAKPDFIRIRGARQNNLQGFDLDIPVGKLTVVTGLSGAGKSSLVFDTLHAEGQRRYVETFSPYTRQFLELLPAPKVDAVENIRPSVAIKQGNTVKTSRSTVGTMTELCDWFKVWFSHRAELFDPETGKPIRVDNTESVWKNLNENGASPLDPGATILVCFQVAKPAKLAWPDVLAPFIAQGYTRGVFKNENCLGGNTHLACRRRHPAGDTNAGEELSVKLLEEISGNAPVGAGDDAFIIQDRIALSPENKDRFFEAAGTAFRLGQGCIRIFDTNLKHRQNFADTLVSQSGKRFRPASPAMFSFNSPVGACPKCRGFGRVITLDRDKIIPDENKTLREGICAAFQGEIYGESQRHLVQFAGKAKIPLDIPFKKLSKKHRDFIIAGDPNYRFSDADEPTCWYGIDNFFKWLESTTYKMHVRVFLSRFRSYTTCDACAGKRLQPDALCWEWEGSTLPELYDMPVSALRKRLAPHRVEKSRHPADQALDAMLARLGYLEDVGLGYLTLNRQSRTLSGGEVQRVNLTACLGAALADALFVLDEPSVGLHPRDLGRMTGILQKLVSQGNTVVVVEHDESVMRAAENLVEIGPLPGREGGRLVFSGAPEKIVSAKNSVTGPWLAGKKMPPATAAREVNAKTKRLRLAGIVANNLKNLSAEIPLGRFVGLCGVSGSGKSTLLNQVLARCGERNEKTDTDDADAVGALFSAQSDLPLGTVALVDQSPASRSSRSNPALYAGAWDAIRKRFAATPAAQEAAFTESFFSFNAGDGRCPNCGGSGFETVEMQFLADVHVPCPACEGKRFRPEVLAFKYAGKSVADILEMTADEALRFFAGDAAITRALQLLADVGLGYLTLGQPLNTLSGGEAQRLKLVRFLGEFKSEKHSLILLDEPTTGLHREDIAKLLAVLQRLVNAGHSLIVVEHQTDVLNAADWLIELGPEAGDAGGLVVAAGTPATVAAGKTATAEFLKNQTAQFDRPDPSDKKTPFAGITLRGAREHNLRNLDLEIPHNTFSVVTGVSGSGKSSLAFDVLFAEGQRRFLECMSAYARQFVEQLPRPEIDSLTGLPPTVAIEQHVSRGGAKSTVATITEVAQYLRLLYAKIGTPHNPATGNALETATPAMLAERIRKTITKNKKPLLLCAPIVRDRKGHHQPLAAWAEKRGFEAMRIDGKIVPLKNFKPLDRYKTHDIELILAKISPATPLKETDLKEAIRLGKGTCLLCDTAGNAAEWLSTERTDPATGESFPALEPKHFSWNSSQGWCPACRGHGRRVERFAEETGVPHAMPSMDKLSDEVCPECAGARLNPVSRAVTLSVLPQGGHASRVSQTASCSPRKNPSAPQGKIALPALLALPPPEVVSVLKNLALDKRDALIAAGILPEIEARLKFLDRVGLDYLSLDRAADTLSGGEAQRIRLAAQLGSNLAGALYVLDEPSIGLHPQDNERLIESLKSLRDRGNTVLVVEHDEETMRAADRVYDLGPGAGIHGGNLIVAGSVDEIKCNENSITAKYLRNAIKHPLRGARLKCDLAGKDVLEIRGASLHNLKNIDVRFAIGRLNVVCGVSGSGKSTLVRDLLVPAATRAVAPSAASKPRNVGFAALRGANAFKQVILVDQDPIGKTPRSTPATYIGAFDRIRKHFAILPEAKMRGYGASFFSFNTAGGRCETCSGAGRIKLEMNFLPNTYVPCDDCGGTRYGAPAEEIRWNGKNIGDVLAMTFEEAAEFFTFDKHLRAMCALMVKTGLGYLTLGQSSPTLSGGEAQRVKLVSELAKGLPHVGNLGRDGKPQRNLYVLEEPTIGLHQADCERLIELLRALVDQGHTVIVIEHHLDVIAEADHVIELGPVGGAGGGRLLYAGDVPGLAKARTPTGVFVRKMLCAENGDRGATFQIN